MLSISSIPATFPLAWRSSRRAGCSCWLPPHPNASAPHVSLTKHSNRSTRHSRRARRRRRHRHSHRQCAARLRASDTRRAPAAPLSCTAAFTRTLFPDEARERGEAHSRRDRRWRPRLADRACATAKPVRPSRGMTADASRAAVSCRRGGIWCEPGRYMWASVQTVRGCAKHCSFCSVWRTDGQQPRNRACRLGCRRDRRAAATRLPLHRAGGRQLLSRLACRIWRRRARLKDPTRLHELEQLRADRFELMEQLAKLPSDTRLLHADHDGSRRGSGIPRRDAARAHSWARWSASNRSPPKA